MAEYKRNLPVFWEGSFFVRLFFVADLYGADQYEYGADELDNG